MNTNRIAFKASDVTDVAKLASFGTPECKAQVQGMVQTMYAQSADEQYKVIRGVMHLLLAICAPDDDVAVEVNERNHKAIQLVADIVYGFGDRMGHL